MSREPKGMTFLGPNRSCSEPMKKATPECTNMKREKTPAVLARSHPNSFRMATKNTEKEYQMPKPMAKVTKEMLTIVHP